MPSTLYCKGEKKSVTHHKFWENCGSGHERILYDINAFNNALKSGRITTTRFKKKLSNNG